MVNVEWVGGQWKAQRSLGFWKAGWSPADSAAISCAEGASGSLPFPPPKTGPDFVVVFKIGLNSTARGDEK